MRERWGGEAVRRGRVHGRGLQGQPGGGLRAGRVAGRGDHAEPRDREQPLGDRLRREGARRGVRAPLVHPRRGDKPLRARHHGHVVRHPEPRREGRGLGPLPHPQRPPRGQAQGRHVRGGPAGLRDDPGAGDGRDGGRGRGAPLGGLAGKGPRDGVRGRGPGVRRRARHRRRREAVRGVPAHHRPRDGARHRDPHLRPQVQGAGGPGLRVRPLPRGPLLGEAPREGHAGRVPGLQAHRRAEVQGGGQPRGPRRERGAVLCGGNLPARRAEPGPPIRT